MVRLTCNLTDCDLNSEQICAHLAHNDDCMQRTLIRTKEHRITTLEEQLASHKAAHKRIANDLGQKLSSVTNRLAEAEKRLKELQPVVKAKALLATAPHPVGPLVSSSKASHARHKGDVIDGLACCIINRRLPLDCVQLLYTAAGVD